MASANRNLWLLLSTFFLTLVYASNDRLPFNDGFGFDGARYGTAVLQLYSEDYLPDRTVIRRILPSIIVRGVHDAVGITPTATSAITGFIILNAICVLIGLLAVDISLRSRQVGVLSRGLAWVSVLFTFALVKWNSFYPVLTDTLLF